MTFRLLLAATLTAGLAVPVAAQLPADYPYSGAESCKTCHAKIFASWEATKHARAVHRLGGAEKEGGQCIQCHATGTPEMIAAEKGKPSFPGVQCESCHGPGRAHAEAAAANPPAMIGGLVKEPGSARCEKCHSQKSPHYRGFSYIALKAFSHPVK